jgi:hypothetical protein
MKLHIKGFLLVELSQSERMWDDALIQRTMNEYKTSGEYMANSLKIALDELASAGLITRLSVKLDPSSTHPALLFEYALSDFGRSRMQDTGLLNTEASS